VSVLVPGPDGEPRLRSDGYGSARWKPLELSDLLDACDRSYRDRFPRIPRDRLHHQSRTHLSLGRDAPRGAGRPAAKLGRDRRATRSRWPPPSLQASSSLSDVRAPLPPRTRRPRSVPNTRLPITSPQAPLLLVLQQSRQLHSQRHPALLRQPDAELANDNDDFLDRMPYTVRHVANGFPRVFANTDVPK
jgi:hypothetical protein